MITAATRQNRAPAAEDDDPAGFRGSDQRLATHVAARPIHDPSSRDQAGI